MNLKNFSLSAYFPRAMYMVTFSRITVFFGLITACSYYNLKKSFPPARRDRIRQNRNYFDIRSTMHGRLPRMYSVLLDRKIFFKIIITYYPQAYGLNLLSSHNHE